MIQLIRDNKHLDFRFYHYGDMLVFKVKENKRTGLIRELSIHIPEGEAYLVEEDLVSQLVKWMEQIK